MSASRRLAASRRSSARAARARASPTASSAARAALSASASAFSASARRSAAARRSAVAVSISPISALPLLGEFLPARLSSSARSVVGLGAALADGGDLRRGAVAALAPFGALGGDRLQAAARQARPRARSPAPRPALRRSALRSPAMTSLTAVELGFDVGGGRQRGERASASSRAAWLRRGWRRCAPSPRRAPRRAPRCG